MNDWGAKQNRFGGFGLSFDRWHVDVWALEDTWARTAGLRQVNELRDLIHCTFFDWDAVVYDLETGVLHFKENYFEALKTGFLK